jgi:molecular chaperone Hsp33
MSDELVSAIFQQHDVRVVLAITTGLSRHARGVHQAHPASAAVLAQGLTGAVVLAALQKERTRVSLQLECDGPLRGFFADADTEGKVRGYVKNRLVEFVGEPGRYHFRPVLGNKGYLSVLRDLGAGEFYRSSVELKAVDLEKDLEHYFQSSDQVVSRLKLVVAGSPGEELGQVGALLLQALPDAASGEVARLGERAAGFEAALGQPFKSAAALLTQLFEGEDLEVLARYPLAYACTCSRERVERALLSMGAQSLRELIEEDKRADVTCEFCMTHYVLEEAELRALLERVERPG